MLHGPEKNHKHKCFRIIEKKKKICTFLLLKSAKDQKSKKTMKKRKLCLVIT